MKSHVVYRIQKLHFIIFQSRLRNENVVNIKFVLEPFTTSRLACKCKQLICIVNIYILMRYWVVLTVCSCAIETTFRLSNLKTKHTFGILIALGNFEDHLGRRRHPNMFLPPPKAALSEGEGYPARGGCFANINQLI